MIILTHVCMQYPVSRSNEPVSSFPMPVTSSTSTPLDAENPEDWKPFKDADAALRELTKKIDNEEW